MPLFGWGLGKDCPRSPPSHCPRQPAAPARLSSSFSWPAHNAHSLQLRLWWPLPLSATGPRRPGCSFLGVLHHLQEEEPSRLRGQEQSGCQVLLGSLLGPFPSAHAPCLVQPHLHTEPQQENAKVTLGLHIFHLKAPVSSPIRIKNAPAFFLLI